MVSLWMHAFLKSSQSDLSAYLVKAMVRMPLSPWVDQCIRLRLHRFEASPISLSILLVAYGILMSSKANSANAPMNPAFFLTNSAALR